VKEKERKKELRKKCGLTQQEEEKRNFFKKKYNFSSVVTKRLAFLPTIKKLTPHLKDKKCTKKFYTLQQLIGWLKKKEKRRRKKKEEWGAEGVRWVLPEGRPATSQQVDDRPPRPTAGSRRPWVWFFFFFLLLLLVV
jgi:hypothetical protein